MAKNRYVGDYPVIGIRPIVDGRRGPMMLRESLEGQVMAMANTQVTQNSILAEDLSALKEQFSKMFENITAEAETAKKVAEAVADKIAKSLEDIAKQDIDNTLDENILNELNIESIESETASTGGESLLSGQSAEEQGIKAMLSQEAESFDIKIEKALKNYSRRVSFIQLYGGVF